MLRPGTPDRHLRLSRDALLQEERLREEAAAKATQGAKTKTVAKKTLNVGKTGGSAGLEDYIYDADGGDDFDFM